MQPAQIIKEQLLAFANPEKSRILMRFFKTGKGEYGEGDLFLGIPVPTIRKVAHRATSASLTDISELIQDSYHEVRMCGFLILRARYRKSKQETERSACVSFYLQEARRANNWDLVDLSAPGILGDWLADHDRSILYRLSESDCVWEQRIAIVSTLSLIRNGEFEDTFRLSIRYLDHPHDLIRKATGWMLREVGKRDRTALTGFLDRYKHRLSRVSLRYAIEHYSKEERALFMQKKP